MEEADLSNHKSSLIQVIDYGHCQFVENQHDRFLILGIFIEAFNNKFLAVGYFISSPNQCT